MIFNLARLVLISFLFFLTLEREVYAQQSILNIPSTDTVSAGKTNIKATIRFRPFRDEFVNSTPTITQGVGFDTEIYLGVPVGIERDTEFNDFDSEVNLNLGIKKAATITKTTRIAIGTQLSPSLQVAETPRNSSYLIISQQIPVTSSRLTSGIYLRNEDEFMPEIIGALLGFEQTLIKDKFSLLLDWTSRNEPFGVLATGIQIRPTSTTSLKGGVLIPNGSEADFAFIISISKTF